MRACVYAMMDWNVEAYLLQGSETRWWWEIAVRERESEPTACYISFGIKSRGVFSCVFIRINEIILLEQNFVSRGCNFIAVRRILCFDYIYEYFILRLGNQIFIIVKILSKKIKIIHYINTYWTPIKSLKKWISIHNKWSESKNFFFCFMTVILIKIPYFLQNKCIIKLSFLENIFRTMFKCNFQDLFFSRQLWKMVYYCDDPQTQNAYCVIQLKLLKTCNYIRTVLIVLLVQWQNIWLRRDCSVNTMSLTAMMYYFWEMKQLHRLLFCIYMKLMKKCSKKPLK